MRGSALVTCFIAPTPVLLVLGILGMSSGTDVEYFIVPITEKDTKNVNDFLDRFFFQDEPLVECLRGIWEDPENKSEEPDDFGENEIMQGLSLMAVDKQGKILGVRLNELLTREKDSIKDPEYDEKIEKCPDPIYKLIWKLLDKVYWETNPFEKFPEVNKVMNFKLLSVDTAYRGQGIAKALVERSIALARERDIPLIRVDCSSAYSAKAMARLGFELVYTLPYTEYVDSDGRPVFNPKPPHTALQSYIKRVDS